MRNFTVLSISAAPWVPLSAVYPYDLNLSLQPNFVEWQDGYTTISHPIFEYAKDVRCNRHSTLYLSQSGSFFDFFSETPRSPAILGAYVALKIDGEYVTNISDTLYLSGTTVGQPQYFRLIVNDNGTVSFFHGDGLYVTVSKTLPFDLTLQPELATSEIDRQQFRYYVKDRTKLLIWTEFDNPAPGFGPDMIKRFWSYDQTDRVMRAIGVWSDDDYSIANNYLFLVEGLDIVFPVTGLVRDQTWIRYYNELADKRNNRNVVPFGSRCVSGVDVNRLVDLPYETKINIARHRMQVNIANLKAVQTAEYEYNVRPQR